MHVYSDSEIVKSQQKTQKLLREFPELWALRKNWGVHGWRDVKICRAPAIHFLEGGICPSSETASIKAYTVTDQPSLHDVTITHAGNSIFGIGEYKVGDPDGFALRDLVRHELFFHRTASDVMGNILYIFLLEEGGASRWLVTIVKPPIGHTDFSKYTKKFFNS